MVLEAEVQGRLQRMEGKILVHKGSSILKDALIAWMSRREADRRRTPAGNSVGLFVPQSATERRLFHCRSRQGYLGLRFNP